MIPEQLLRRLVWSDDFVTNDTVVDYLHRTLLLQISGTLGAKASTPSQSELAATVSEILGILKAHFSAEEKMGTHEEGANPLCEVHSKHHQAYLEQMKSYERDLAAGEAVYSVTTLSLLARDLINHIKFEANLLKRVNTAAKISTHELLGKYILAVDDEEDLRNIFKDELEDRGAKVELASGGNEALSLIIANSFDLVLTDIKMPNGDGLELLKNIRGLDPHRPPVVLISANFPHPEEHLRTLGAQALVTKPVKFDHFVPELLTLI